jgi:predicted nuclease of predicted toxin-antitoxin system
MSALALPWRVGSSSQHDVFSVYEEARGVDDDEVIQRAFAENRILITNDKDFGEKVYREPTIGVISCLVMSARQQNRCIRRLLSLCRSHLVSFVVTETKIRFARINPANTHSLAACTLPAGSRDCSQKRPGCASGFCG